MISHGSQSRIHCWVKVVDQHDQGVSGYKCQVTEQWAPLLPFLRGGPTLRTYETQADGIFEYDSKKAVGEVYFGHWDTQWTLNPRNLIERDNLRVDALHLVRDMKEAPSNYMGSKENPYLLHVFSLGPPQKLLYWSKRIKLEKAGDYACIDILAGKLWESEVPEGDIAMQDHPYERGKPNPRCTITFVSGKSCILYPVIDDWGLCPPESGYQSEVCRPSDWQSRRKRDSIGIEVYFRLTRERRAVPVYGKVSLGLSIYVDRAMLECYGNLRGERNLYFKGYEKSVFTFDPGQIEDYVSPPVE
jgi:hypothetical protein